MEEHYRKIVGDTDQRVRHTYKKQICDPKRPDCGGVPDENGIIQAKYTIYRIAPMLAAYLCPESAFYRQETIACRILSGLSYVERCQHSNGLFDYVLCNFNSAPDTAFCMKKLIPFYEYLSEHPGRKTGEEIWLKIRSILKKGATGLPDGGFHTPNHRWAIASVLLWCFRIFGFAKDKTVAELYLQEGIDCNEDGEYSEKSAGNYNRINNDAMLLIAKERNDDRYEQPVIRNLKMMLTYLESDGSIFTANSTRYDKDQLVYPKNYYLQYLSLGLKYQDRQFLSAAGEIFWQTREKQLRSPDVLIHFLNHPEYRKAMWEPEPLPNSFDCFYRKSAIARVRRADYTFTVMGRTPGFFYFHYGKLRLELRLCGSFYEYRSFQAETMERQPDGTLYLAQSMRGWYYRPFDTPQQTADWWEMDPSKRRKLCGSEYDMKIEVRISEIQDGAKLHIRMSGITGAPFRIIFALSGVSQLEGDSFLLPVTGGESLVAKSGMVRAAAGEEILEFGPGFAAHRLLEAKEYAEMPASAQAEVYFTDYTELDREIFIRKVSDTSL